MDVNLSNKIKVLLNKNFTENGLIKNVFIKCNYLLRQRLIIVFWLMTPCRLASEKYVASNFTVEENSILAVESIRFFEMLVSICQTTRCHYPYYHNLIFTAMKTSCHKNLRSRIKTWFQNHMAQSCSLQVVNVNWYWFISVLSRHPVRISAVWRPSRSLSCIDRAVTQKCGSSR